MRSLRFHQVDAFTLRPFSDNPASMVPDANELDERQMQIIARELNCSETAFLLRPSATDHEVWIRFFTPTVEVPSCSHATIMIGLRHRAALHELRPHREHLLQISREKGCNGFYAFTLDAEREDLRAHGRMFAPAIGIDEDPVTGNASGPLGAYLAQHHLVELPTSGPFVFRVRQGEAMGRPGEVEVRVDLRRGRPHRVRVAGRAVLTLRGEIRVP